MIHIALAILAFIVVAGFSAAIIDLLLTHWRVVAAVSFVVLLASQVPAGSRSAAQTPTVCHPQTEWLWLPTLLKCD